MGGWNRVEIETMLVDGEEVGGKACTKCHTIKPLLEFRLRKEGAGGRESRCKACERKPGARSKVVWAPNEYLDYVKTSSGGEYDVIGSYSGSMKKITHKHNACGGVWDVTPNSFLRGTRCPFCHINARKTTEQFIEEVSLLEGSNYSVLGNYIGARTPILVRHNECRSEYKVAPGHFRSGKRCPVCAGNVRKTTEQFHKKVTEITAAEYEVLGDYKNAHVKLTMLHRTCSRSFDTRPHDFLRGRRCPFCVSSRGEVAIRTYLSEHSYTFTEQYRIPNCRDVAALPFDFAIHSLGVDLLIEYDGIQHFEPVDFAGRGDVWAQQQFRGVQRRDRIKTTYCITHGIPLIRISYVDFDRIDEILDEALAKYCAANVSEVFAA